ncbi:MAG TPA: chemotaxis protein CheW [Patescibacteria group bacterium]|nr:chemotaxis protein CheW [Patescibacteria group bacterium]
MKPEKVLTFYIDDILFGIAINTVKEVQRRAEYYPVPGAPAHLLGLMNLRGQIVTLFDMEQILLQERWRERPERSGCVVLKPRPDDPYYTGFLIDRAGEVLEFDADQTEPLPANLRGLGKRNLTHIVRLSETLLVVIQLDEVLDSL